MHLALIISSLSSGGAERVLSDLANHWTSQGHEVSLATLAHPDTKPFYPLDPAIRLIQLNQSQSEISLWTRLRNILRRVRVLRKTLKALNPNVILSFVDVMNLTTLLAVIGLNIPIIISERVDPHFYRLPVLYRWFRIYVYALAQKIVVQTQSASNYFPFRLRKIIRIIPNVVKAPQVSKKILNETTKNIVSMGRLNQQKDHQTLIYAFFGLHKTYPHLQLTIYGEGKERSNLESLIRTFNLQGKVLLPGVTKNAQQVLLSADLFVFPSRYEGFPNALCEAMAVGLPVIASNCSGNVDIVRDGIDGRLFPVGNVEALIAVMEELLNDEDQRTRLAQHAQTICERFHPHHVLKLWDDVVDQTLKVISS